MERQIPEMKTQEDELKRRLALLKAEEEIEKAKGTDGVYAGTEYPKSERKPVYKEEVGGKPLARAPLPREDPNQVRRNYSRSELNPSAEPWHPGPPRTIPVVQMSLDRNSCNRFWGNNTKPYR